MEFDRSFLAFLWKLASQVSYFDSWLFWDRTEIWLKNLNPEFRKIIRNPKTQVFAWKHFSLPAGTYLKWEQKT